MSNETWKPNKKWWQEIERIIKNKDLSFEDLPSDIQEQIRQVCMELYILPQGGGEGAGRRKLNLGLQYFTWSYQDRGFMRKLIFDSCLKEAIEYNKLPNKERLSILSKEAQRDLIILAVRQLMMQNQMPNKQLTEALSASDAKFLHAMPDLQKELREFMVRQTKSNKIETVPDYMKQWFDDGILKMTIREMIIVRVLKGFSLTNALLTDAELDVVQDSVFEAFRYMSDNSAYNDRVIEDRFNAYGIFLNDAQQIWVASVWGYIR